MANIHNWISTHRKKGYSNAQLANHLRKHGYDEKHIHSLLGTKARAPPSIHKHHPRSKTTVHHAAQPHDKHQVKQRNLFVMILLWIVTLGIYPLVWIGMSAVELRKTNKKTPDVRMFVLAIVLPILFSLFLPVATFLPLDATVLAITLIVLTVIVALASIILQLIFYILYGIVVQTETRFPAWVTVVLLLLVPVVGMLAVQHVFNTSR